jgi:hypothetical protein
MKGGNRFGDEKSLGRKKEIKYSIFLLLSLNFHYNPIPPISSHLIQLWKGKNLH